MAIGLDSVLKTVELPTGIAHLDSGLADMNGQTFTHVDVQVRVEGDFKKLDVQKEQECSTSNQCRVLQSNEVTAELGATK